MNPKTYYIFFHCNRYILGVQKCGTSSLYPMLLGQIHGLLGGNASMQKVKMPKLVAEHKNWKGDFLKENHFFDVRSRFSSGGLGISSPFLNCSESMGAVAAVDATPAYFSGWLPRVSPVTTTTQGGSVAFQFSLVIERFKRFYDSHIDGDWNSRMVRLLGRIVLAECGTNCSKL